MAKQRIRVAGRDARLVAAIALVAGVLAASAGLEPTASRAVDAGLVFVATAFVVWAAASAPWWAGVAAAGIATAFAPSIEWLVVGLVPLFGGLAIGGTRRSLPWSRALTAGISIQVFAHLGNSVFFGFTSLLAVTVLTALAILGVRRRPRTERRWLWIGLGTGGGVLAIGVFGFALAASSARPEIEDGNRAARDGIDQLADGDLAAASASFSRAADQFAAADADLDKPWGQPVRLVPVAARYRRSASVLVNTAAAGSRQIAQQLASIDYDQLRVVNGRIDLDVVRSLQAPIEALQATLNTLVADVERASDRWLPQSVNDRLIELQADLAEQQPDLETARVAITQAPAMLGAEGPRTYFLAFTTPSEARGTGGFMGNFAVVSIDNGAISVTDFGRTGDLADVDGEATEKTIESQSAEFVDLWGPAYFRDSARLVAHSVVWSNITASPHFPSVAEVMAELYPQSGGTEIDGAFVFDVYSLAALMQITGPVELANGTTIDTATAAQYLLREQYLTDDNEARIDDLETVARVTVDRLLSSTLPSPPQLSELFSPMAQQGRLVGWAARPEEEAVLARVNMTGALPSLNGGDGFTFAFNNGSGNKIDAFLEGDATYDVQLDRGRGRVSATATLTLRNEAPAGGLPDYVIGNVVGLPPGTSRLQVALYTALPVRSFRIDSEDKGFTAGVEQGYFVTTTFIDIPPGETVTVRLTVGGDIDPAAAYRLVTRTPAVVTPMPLQVSIDGTALDPGPPVPGVRRYG